MSQVSPARGGHTTPVLTLTVGSSVVAPPSYRLGGVAKCQEKLQRLSRHIYQPTDRSLQSHGPEPDPGPGSGFNTKTFTVTLNTTCFYLHLTCGLL